MLDRPRGFLIPESTNGSLVEPKMSMQELQAGLPPGFQVLVREKRLSSATTELLHRVASYAGYNQLPCPYANQEKHEDFARFSPASGTATATFDEILCLSLFLYAVTLLRAYHETNFAWSATHLAQRSRLTNLVPDFQAADHVERTCLVWIWLILANSWRRQDRSFTPQGEEILMSFRHRFEEYASVAAVRPICGHYFWKDEYYEGFDAAWNQEQWTRPKISAAMAEVTSIAPSALT